MEFSEELMNFIDENVATVEKYYSFHENNQDVSLYGSGGEHVEAMEKRCKDLGGEFFSFNWEPKEEDTEERARFKEMFGIDPFLDLDLKDYRSDNSYNWSWLGPADFNTRLYHTKDKQKWFYFIQIHGGGDARSNYIMPYVFEVERRHCENEGWFLIDFYTGSVHFTATFNDGSSISFYSEQDSDTPRYKYDSVNICAARYANREQMTFLSPEEEKELNDKEDEAKSLATKFLNLMKEEIEDGYHSAPDIDDLVDEMESKCTRVSSTDEETKLKKLYEGLLNAELGTQYGWTMMQRGTMRRVFEPKKFEDGYNEWKKTYKEA